MKLYHLSSGPLRVNSYFLVADGGKEAVLIDGGENYKLIKRTEEQYGFKVKYLLLTHAHFDHAGNAALLQADGAKVLIGEKDAGKLSGEGNLGEMFGRKFNPLYADRTLKDGEKFNLAGIDFQAIHTPGHTDGSMTYMTGNMLFTGDTLFLGTVGRTDFPTGDRDALVRSVKKLFALCGDYAVYPGHDGFTTLENERKNNVMAEYD